MKPQRSVRARFYRTKWLAPVVAAGLALGSVGLGQLAQDRILAQPEQPITFIVDGELPYGITQETVDAAAEDVALSYEPFTIMVVERELTWDEYQHGKLPDGVDVMLSVGIDPDDLDLSLPAAHRVSIAKLNRADDGSAAFRASKDVRETFLNNVTQGHGPSAVVGAALTAGSGSFDGPSRSPVLWVSVAALPLLASLLIIGLWARYIARERARRQLFSRARLQLARVVLELDLLDLHMNVAGAELDRAQGRAVKQAAEDVKRKLTTEWRAIRSESLRLAHDEQLLAREILDPSTDVHERGMPSETLPVDDFATQADALRRRVDALVAASSVRGGLASGGTALEQIALSSTLAVDDVLDHAQALSAHETQLLQQHRGDLLALLREAETTFGSQPGPEVIADHAELIQRWRETEGRLAQALVKIRKRLHEQAPSQTKPDDTLVSQRVEERTRVATGGKLSTIAELRSSLGLASGSSLTPALEAERVLLQIETNASGATSRGRLSTGVDKLAPSFTPVAVVGIPVIAALVTGFVALGTIGENHTSSGRTITGDQPLAALHVIGDTSLLPEITDPASGAGEPPNRETLTVDYVRDKMQWMAKRTDAALLPEKIELIVAILPVDDFVKAHPHETSENRIEIDYLDLLDAYPRIKADVATSYPEAIDPQTGDVAQGFAILPLWIGDDHSFGSGLALTGTLSSGVDSRLGRYSFTATEPLMRTSADGLSAGWMVADDLSQLGREMEYNHQRAADLAAGPLFWTVAITTWTGLQAIGIIGWSVAQVLLRGAGSRRAREELRGLREKLNKLALDLDLSRLDAVAVLGEVDGHDGQAAEADQQLYETMLFTAWREVQELEELPRRMQRGTEWRARVERMSAVIDALARRDATTADRALELVRSYDPITPAPTAKDDPTS